MSSARLAKKGVTRALSAFGRAREGGVAVVVALSIVVLVGSAALALDLGRLYSAVTELDNAADAAAIAAASQLIGTDESCARAIAAATNANLENLETFADNSAGPPVFIDNRAWPTNTNIRFLRTLVKNADGILIGDYIDTFDDIATVLNDPDIIEPPLTTDPNVCDTDAGFVEVTVDQGSLGNFYTVVFDFAQVVGAVGEAHPKGYAVAGIGRLFCGEAPMFMCEFTGDNPMSFDDLLNNTEDYRGRGVWLKSERNNQQLGEGNFGFLALEGTSCGGGTDCLRDFIGMADPDLPCVGLSNLSTEPGASSGARHGFNTRFGIYQGGGIDPNDPIWQPAAVTMKGLVRTGGSCNIASWEPPGVTYNGVGSLDPLRASLTDAFDPGMLPMGSGTGMGFPKDDCAFPGGSCMGDDPSERLGEDCGAGNCWDVEAYLTVNHDKNRTGLADDLDPAGGGYATFEEALRDRSDFMGVGPFAGRITRWMVYQWELGYSGAYADFDDPKYGQVDLANNDYHVPDNIIDPLTSDAFTAIGVGNSQLLPMPLDAPPPLMPSTPHADEFGGPHEQCYSAGMGNVFSPFKGANIKMKMDRRVMEIVMVNCDPDNGGFDIQGRTTGIDGTGYVQVFLPEPWIVNGSQHEMYSEIIGPVDREALITRAVEIVQLYE